VIGPEENEPEVPQESADEEDMKNGNREEIIK